MERRPYSEPPIFELAGKRTAQETEQLMLGVSEILKNETGLGKNKLGKTIEETRMGGNGHDYFVDGKIVYLPPRGTAIFVGDTHADSITTETIIKQVDFFKNVNKNKDFRLVFLGDYTGRGLNDVRNIEIILNLKRNFPENVVLLKGNHEENRMMINDDLDRKFIKQFASDGNYLFEKYKELIDLLPNMLVAGNGIVAVHGGIPSLPIKDLFMLKDNEELFSQMRWNDPDEKVEGIEYNFGRGGKTKSFGQDAFEEFMDVIGGKIMVRSHEYFSKGHKFMFEGRLLTIFSTGRKSTESSYPTSPKIARAYLANPVRVFTPLNILDVEQLKN